MGKNKEKKIRKTTLKKALIASEIRYRTEEELIEAKGKTEKKDSSKSAFSQV
ncbi:MAG: hypothetical protein AAGU19_21665 [Prolixibacteraceae bacterium]